MAWKFICKEKICLSLVLMIGLLACSDDPGSPMQPIGGEDDGPVDTEPKGIVFDAEFTDLTALPKDEGGQHLAKPVTSLLSPLGHYMYVPGGYDSNDLEYPLIMFLHGGGQTGNSFLDASELDRVLDHGPPFMIANMLWNPKFPCLVASPQITDGDWTPIQLSGFIRHLLSNYRVNKTRIYLTGLSRGGRGCWSYAGQTGLEGYASAIVPICGSGGNPSNFENLGKIPIWAFHGDQDDVISAFTQNGSVPMVEQINSMNPIHKAKVTIYPGIGHDSWTQTYNGLGMGTESADYDAFDMSIYEWMFQYRKEK